MKPPRVTATAPAAAVALALACATPATQRYAPLAAPRGDDVLGLTFGADRGAAERALARAGIAARPADGDEEALVAERCPAAPVAAPCRLVFGPAGLYAAELEVPGPDAPALAAAVARGLGERSRPANADVDAALVAAWDRPPWVAAVTRHEAAAVLRVVYEPAAPPVVQGVAFGGLRGEIERDVAARGATLVHRDGESTTYLGCPGGSADAVSCVVLFRRGRAASVTEVLPAPSDDAGALGAWRALARRYESDIGRAARLECPSDGPDRVAGDCTATWATDRLVIVVGAHRNAGSRHRGAISVYTAFTYPPLAAPGAEEDAVTEEPSP